MLCHVCVQGNAFCLEEARTDGLGGTETGGKSVVKRLYIAMGYHSFQLGHTETVDVVVHIVEALTAYALQDKVPIVAGFLA